MSFDTDSVSRILKEASIQTRGPGGAMAVLKDGEVVATQTWGYSDLEKRIPMTAETIMPICSISKQMVCGLLTDLENNPTPEMENSETPPGQQLADQLPHLLRTELLQDTGLTLQHLCNNQSGIRDYWALTVLWGAKAEGHYSIAEHNTPMLDRLRSFHFKPGTSYSYANTNFNIVGRVIERATGRPLGELLEERIFKPAGMTTAKLCAHAAEHPGSCIGYEGNEENGFFPAVNCIEWAGDAGIVASLADMISYEKYIDRNRAEPNHWYSTNASKQTFADGKPAAYSNGLGSGKAGAVQTIGHGGALRGYRLNRVYAPERRVSVVVLLNQERSGAGEVATKILKRLLGVTEAEHELIGVPSEWSGCYLDPETQMAITVKEGEKGQILLKYHRSVEKMRLVEAMRAESKDMTVVLEGDSLRLTIPDENRVIHAARVSKANVDLPIADIQGDYRCEEIDSNFHCSGEGGMLYGFFEGFLGTGPIHLIRYAADDVWFISCPRSMDAPSPGDWTLVVHRDGNGKVSSLTIGSWLARRLEFVKTK